MATPARGHPALGLMRIRNIPLRTDLFDFELPEDRIALYPLPERDAARLLVVQPNSEPEIADRTVAELPELLRAGDMLVFNDTRVIPAALKGTRIRGDAEAQDRKSTRLNSSH